MKKSLIALVFILAAIVVNSPWFWNIYAAAFDDEQYRLPMTQTILAGSDSGYILNKDLGPGVFTVSIESNSVAVADGITKEVRVYISVKDEEREFTAKGVVYNGAISAKPFTFSLSLLQSRRGSGRIGFRWKSDPSIPTLTFSVRRAY